MRPTWLRQIAFAAVAILGLAWWVGDAVAGDRLTEIGARLSAVDVDTTRVTAAREIDLGGDVVTATFITAHTASGKALQRNHLGFWIPWNGQLSSLVNNHFPADDGRVGFKILKDEDMSAELFPVRITLAYRTAGAFKFGVFELRDSVQGANQ